MPYFAQIDNSSQVLRVIVADDITWPQTRLGGTWHETQYDGTEQYAGIGFYHDDSSQWKFAPAWRQPTGSEDAYPLGSYCYHDGQIWQSKLPANVWEPGVVGWRDPISEVAQWQQPVGSVDAYADDDIVFHNGKEWQSKVSANVWEPGGVGIGSNIWEDITDSPPVDTDEWAANTAYTVADEVTYDGNSYACLQSHTSQVGWEPPNVPALWLAI